MNVPTITMPADEARRKFEAYRRQLQKRTDDEYQAALTAYQALAEGKRVINLQDVFTPSILGADNRPKVAIARADRKQVMVEMRWGWVVFNATKGFHRTGYQGDLVISIPFPDRHVHSRGYALVPMVPADVRPTGNLKDYFILWEVERWVDRPLLAGPDTDPYLLKRLWGSLYAVVAEWELTELERAIMAGRREG